MQNIDPKAKIISLFAFIILCVTLPPGKYEALAAYSIFALFLLAVSNIPIRYFFTRILAILPFVGFFAVTIPFLWANGNLQMTNLYMTVVTKALISITVITVLSPKAAEGQEAPAGEEEAAAAAGGEVPAAGAVA